MNTLDAVVVSGRSGFLGAAVTKILSERGKTIIGIDSPRRHFETANEDAKTISISGSSSVDDLIDKFSTFRNLKFVHLATHYSGQHVTGDIEKFIEANVALPLRVSEALSRTNKGTRVVNISTVFQQFGKRRYSPTSLYAASKQACLDLLVYYAELKQLDVIDLTIADTYSNNDPRPKLLPMLIRAAHTGETVELGSGSQLLSFLHVDDVARGVVEALNLDSETNHDQLHRLTLGPTTSLTIRELVATIEQVSGGTLSIIYNPERDRQREIREPIIPTIPILPGYIPEHDFVSDLKALLNN